MQFEHMHHIHFLYSPPTGSEVSISIDMEAEQDFMNRVSKYDFEIFKLNNYISLMNVFINN